MARKQKFRSAADAQRHRELTASWEKLLAKYPPSTKGATASSYSLDEALRSRRRGVAHTLPSVVTPPTVQAKAAQPLSEDMIERERLAQARSAQLRKRLAPLYNKGPYQYITDDTDLSEIGKKL